MRKIAGLTELVRGALSLGGALLSVAILRLYYPGGRFASLVVIAAILLVVGSVVPRGWRLQRLVICMVAMGWLLLPFLRSYGSLGQALLAITFASLPALLLSNYVEKEEV